MSVVHVFVETNFLFSVFRPPWKRRRDALELKSSFDAGKVKLYIPYLCLQEAVHLISQKLPTDFPADLPELHRFATDAGVAKWEFAEMQKLVSAARAEVSRIQATFRHEITSLARSLGNGVLHGTRDVFDFLEQLQLDQDLKYNDKLILSSVLVKAVELKIAGESRLFFCSTDKKDFEPTESRQKLAKSFADAGVEFVRGFVLPGAARTPS